MALSPLSLIAEITHRCPLHCLYCSNPLELQRRDAELTTAAWQRVFKQAAELGMLHLHLTGGEPLARHDLTELVTAGRAAGLYINLITSGLGLTEARLSALVGAGLDHLRYAHCAHLTRGRGPALVESPGRSGCPSVRRRWSRTRPGPEDEKPRRAWGRV